MQTMLLEDCCEILDSMRIPITAANRQEGPYPYYGANGIQDYVAEYIFDDELVLLAEDGGNFGSKTRPIAYRVSGKCWVNNHAHVLKPKTGLDVDFLCYSLMFYNTDGLVNGATRQKLTQATMRKMQIPDLPLKEQKEIVNQLNTIVAIKDMRNRELQRLDELIKARFIEMFGDPVDNPYGWPTKGLMELGSCKNGMNFGARDQGTTIQSVGVGDIKDYDYIEDIDALTTLSLNETPTEEYLLRDGDLVFVRSNGNKNLVGRCTAIYPHGIPVTFSGFCIRFRKESDAVLLDYLLRYLKMPEVRLQMSGRGANIQNLNQKILAALQVPVPPLDKQSEYVALVKQSDKSKVAIQKSLDETQLLFDSLMQEYFG